jgi:hypothetical protein
MEVNLEMKNIAHSWPTGDLFRAVTIESLDSKGKRLDISTIARSYDMSDKKLLIDTTLHEEKNMGNDKTAKKTMILYYDTVPEKCRVIYRSQGLIEDILIRDFSSTIINQKFRRTLYDGICINRKR